MCHSPLRSLQIWGDSPWDSTSWDRGPQIPGCFLRCSSVPQTPPPQTCSHRLHGSYEVMRGGHMNEAFVDFTGGVGEVLYLRQNIPGLFSVLRHALAKESLVGATALVRGSDSHGAPARMTAQSGLEWGGDRGPPPLCFHCWRMLSHVSNSNESKGNLFAFFSFRHSWIQVLSSVTRTQSSALV